MSEFSEEEMLEGDIATYEGLEKWYCCMFKKLGWMVLANQKGHHEKITEYVKCLKALDSALTTKYGKTQNVDKQQDLMIMKTNLQILIKHTHGDFKIPMTGGKRKKGTKKGSRRR